MCIFCLFGNLRVQVQTWLFDVCLYAFCGSVQSERINLIYIFFRKWKLYYSIKKRLWPIMSLTQLIDFNVRLELTSALTALKYSQVLFHGSNPRKILNRLFKEGKEKTVYSRPSSVCTNIPSEKNIYYMHWKKLFTYWMLPVYVEKFRCNKMHSVISVCFVFILIPFYSYCVI